MTRKTVVAVVALLLAGALDAADSVIGYWKTIDDKTNQEKSIVRIYAYEGKVFGRVVKVLTDPTATAKIPGSPKIEGLDIIKNLSKNGEKYEGGKVLDPKSGSVYSCQIWLDKGDLIMRGSLFGFGRKQTWKPVDPLPDQEVNPTPKTTW